MAKLTVEKFMVSMEHLQRENRALKERVRHDLKKDRDWLALYDRYHKAILALKLIKEKNAGQAYSKGVAKFALEYLGER